MSTRPTLCFLTGTLNAFAGAERMTAVIANELARRGYTVHVLSLWDRSSCFTLESAVQHEALFDARPSFKRRYAQTVASIRRYLRAHGVDVLVEVDTMLTLFTLPACLGLPVQRIAWEHCDLEQNLGKAARSLARRLAARSCARVVVLTERDAERWHNRLRPPTGRVVAIPNALPFPYPAQEAPRKTRTVLAVGRLTRAKGFDILLQAWARIHTSVPGWRLRIVGDGEERQALLHLRERLGVAHCVALESARSDVETLYCDAAVFCLSSRYEGFGLVLIEAMSFGLPVVSTACETGPVALLRHDDNAWLAPPEDDRALAEALRQTIMDAERMDRLSAAARATASRYAVTEVASQWERVLAALAPRTP